MKTTILGSIAPEEFLRSHWQKNPLLIRQALAEFSSPISGDELAGLALEEEVESRIILEHGSTPWELQQGPFSADHFSSLPDSHWTLLVQAVDHWIPEVHDLLKHFSFLPRWRLDDIMVSYATDGGSVGPHYDQYDVFLLQAQGKRQWKIGPKYDSSSPTLPDTPLHILSRFETIQEFTLEPGDMLYLPPGLGHLGVAIGDCITISIGFRAPSHRDILMQYTDFIADRLAESLRYSDPDLKLPSNPTEIDDATIDRLQKIIHQYTNDREQLGEWFAKLMTQPKYEEDCEPETASWSEILKRYAEMPLSIQDDARVAFRTSNNGVLFFANGHTFTAEHQETRQLIRQLCQSELLHYEFWHSLSETKSQELLTELIAMGVLNSSEA